MRFVTQERPKEQSELEAVVGEIECGVAALVAMIGVTDDDEDALRKAEDALASACGILSAHRMAMEDPYREEYGASEIPASYGRAF